MAIYSLAVDPDTMAMVDYAAEQDSRTQAITAIGQFLQAAWPLGQAKPEAIPMLMQLLQWFLAGFKGAKGIEGVLDQAMAQMAQQPPQPPQPSPAETAAKADAQATMMKAGADVKATQMKTQAKIATDQQKAASQARTKTMKAVVDAVARAQQPVQGGEAALAGLPPTPGVHPSTGPGGGQL
jgi:hypothetical protein